MRTYRLHSSRQQQQLPQQLLLRSPQRSLPLPQQLTAVTTTTGQARLTARLPHSCQHGSRARLASTLASPAPTAADYCHQQQDSLASTLAPPAATADNNSRARLASTLASPAAAALHHARDNSRRQSMLLLAQRADPLLHDYINTLCPKTLPHSELRFTRGKSQYSFLSIYILTRLCCFTEIPILYQFTFH